MGTTLHFGAQASNCSGFFCCRAWALGRTGFSRCLSRALGHRLSRVGGLSCPVACGVFPDQGSNSWPLQWQMDSWPLSHQGNPCIFLDPKREEDRGGGGICVLRNSSLYFLKFYFIFNWWKVALHFVLVSALQQRGSVSLSLFIASSSSPTVSTSLFSTRFISSIYLDSIYIH